MLFETTLPNHLYPIVYSSTAGLWTAVALHLLTYFIVYSSTAGLWTAVSLHLLTYFIVYSSTVGLRTAVPLHLLTYFIVSLFLSLLFIHRPRTAVAADFKRAWVAGYSEVAPNQITLVKGILMKGCRIIIPSVMRLEILDRLHKSHQDITKCCTRAKASVWWPSKQMEDLVHGCQRCAEHKNECTEPLIPSVTPERPWQIVGTDLFHLKVYLTPKNDQV